MYYYFFPSPGLLEKVALVVSFVGRESWKPRTLGHVETRARVGLTSGVGSSSRAPFALETVS